MKRLFGTDGIRGKANTYPMTPEMALNIGRGVATLFKKDAGKSEIIIGKDTRISGDMLEYAIASGICSAGGDAYLAGVLPTPGVAAVTASGRAIAGIVISASHNPFYDNGIKIFDCNGYKLSDEKEGEIERLLHDNSFASFCDSVRNIGRVCNMDEARRLYKELLRGAVEDKAGFRGVKIVLDCSNGATYQVAPELFAEFGAEVESLFISPDGKNINENCGSQHPEHLAKKVIEKGAQIGLAFDGDGDRLIAVDEKGGVITGDQILIICAKMMKQKGILKNNLVVSTVMSNLGFRLALKDMGIRHIEADVGDRYVMKAMLDSCGVIGGEDSGHVIFSEHHTTGDGILTALKLIEAMNYESEPLSELAKIMTVFPQILMNVPVKNKPDIQTIPEIQKEIEAAEKEMGAKGRVLVRYSGTQPLCRIMVEAPTYEKTQQYCQQIAEAVRKRIGIK